MRHLMLIGILALAGASQGVPAPPRTPVLVELFTSEGCSSCPPADALLSTLVHDQPVAGADVIPLELHVTYWDDLGWKDPASLPQATARQQRYARFFGTDNIYTPQAVIDGKTEAVGSDAGALKKAIAKAAARPHAHVSLAATVDGGVVNATITIAGVPPDLKEPLDVVVAIVEDGLTSAVARGENHGLTLHHDAVVRTMLASPASGDGVATKTRLQLRPDWQAPHLRAVAAVQGRSSGRIVGAAVAGLQ